MARQPTDDDIHIRLVDCPPCLVKVVLVLATLNDLQSVATYGRQFTVRQFHVCNRRMGNCSLVVYTVFVDDGSHLQEYLYVHSSYVIRVS